MILYNGGRGRGKLESSIQRFTVPCSVSLPLIVGISAATSITSSGILTGDRFEEYAQSKVSSFKS